MYTKLNSIIIVGWQKFFKINRNKNLVEKCSGLTRCFWRMEVVATSINKIFQKLPATIYPYQKQQWGEGEHFSDLQLCKSYYQTTANLPRVTCSVQKRRVISSINLPSCVMHGYVSGNRSVPRFSLNPFKSIQWNRSRNF